MPVRTLRGSWRGKKWIAAPKSRSWGWDEAVFPELLPEEGYVIASLVPPAPWSVPVCQAVLFSAGDTERQRKRKR